MTRRDHHKFAPVPRHSMRRAVVKAINHLKTSPTSTPIGLSSLATTTHGTILACNFNPLRAVTCASSTPCDEWPSPPRDTLHLYLNPKICSTLHGTMIMLPYFPLFGQSCSRCYFRFQSAHPGKKFLSEYVSSPSILLSYTKHVFPQMRLL